MNYFQDYVILDEGHKIKNPTKTTKGINAVGAKHRIIMTGTPVQNNLKVCIVRCIVLMTDPFPPFLDCLYAALARIF